MGIEKLLDLPEKVYRLFDPEIDHEINEENLEHFCNTLKGVLRSRLAKSKPHTGALRFSSLGRPDRQAWFDAHPVDGGKEQMLPKTYLKFMYGDVIEALLLLLVREAGFSVEDEQLEVEVNGVKGHIDCRIEGVVVDVKSASPYGYKKFENRTVTEDDPFGYVYQLSGYANVLTPGKDAAWLAMDKVSGDICVSPLSSTVIKYHQPEERIEVLRNVLSSDVPPPLCFLPIPDGKSGNEKLPTGCSYCAHKFRCHPGLRVFLASTGPKYLTKVERQPNMLEITDAGSGSQEEG